MRFVLTAMLAGFLLAGCASGPFSDDERAARVGEVFPSVGDVDGRPVSLVLPTSRYDFVISSPHEVTGSPAALLGEEVDSKAGDGRAFVDVSFKRGNMDGDVWPLSPEGNEIPRFWLEYDGTRVELDAQENKAWVVAVPENPEVRLVAEFDGREIAVEPYDQLAPSAGGDVYDGRLPRLTEHHCSPARGVKVEGGAEFGSTDCRVEVLDPVPWFQPAGPTGWAPEGTKYLLARVNIDINTYFSQTINGEYVSRETEYGEPTYTLDGAVPRAMYTSDYREISSRPANMDVHDIRWVLFEVPADARRATLKFRLTFSGIPKDDDSGATTVRHTLRRSIDLHLD